MFSIYLLPSFILLKRKNFKYLKKKKFFRDMYFNFSYKKIFFLLQNIYGFSFQFLYFFLLSIGFNFHSFTNNSKYFLTKYLSFLLLNKKLHLFLFLLRYRFGYCSEYLRSFFFFGLKKYGCLKQMLVNYGLPLRGQRTKTNAATAHHCFYSKTKVKTFSLKKNLYFLF